MKPPEGGRFGAADLQSYTWWLYWMAWAGIISFAQRDLSGQGPSYLRMAFGVESAGWVWTYVALSWLAVALPNQQISLMYTAHTGRIAYGDDRIGYAKSGGRDIAYWCGLIPWVALVVVFAKWVPAGLLSWFRSWLILIGTGVVGVILARSMARRLFTALYGPARYSWPS